MKRKMESLMKRRNESTLVLKEIQNKSRKHCKICNNTADRRIDRTGTIARLMAAKIAHARESMVVWKRQDVHVMITI